MSTSTARAVSLRKGTKFQLALWTGGNLGEVTVDTTDSTLWVHLGDKQPGTPLARADLNNLTAAGYNTLAIGDETNGIIGFMRNDLSNASIDVNSVPVILSKLEPLGYALSNTTNINTADLIDPEKHTESQGNGNKPLAYADLSNINASALIDNIPANTFIKYDLSNIRTGILGGTTPGLGNDEKPLAFKDMSNVDTTSLATNTAVNHHAGKNLMYSDLSNIDNLSSQTISILNQSGLQLTANMVNVANATLVTQYPTALSVKEQFNTVDSTFVAVNQRINEVEQKVPSDPSSTASGNPVYFSYGYQYDYELTLDEGGSGYLVGDELSVGTLRIKVDEVTTGGVISEAELIDACGKTSQTITEQLATGGTGTGAKFSVASTSRSGSGLGWSSINFNGYLQFDNNNSSGGKFILERSGDIGQITNYESALMTLGLNQQTHFSSTSNPHSVTKAQVGLGNCDNTSDLNKPISTATQTALDGKVAKVTSSSKVYATDSSGNQTSLSYTDSNTASTVVMRDSSSQVNVAQTPTANTHATSKKYVDDGLALKANSSALATVATSGSYSDLSGTPSLATVATSGSYSDLTNKPTVDQTYSGTSSNAQSGKAVASAISSAISSVYKPAGTVAFASLPTLSSSIEGNVYNVSDNFTTTADFVEGAGNTYPAGTNVVCINTTDTTYKWDVLAGFVDLSGYQTTITGAATTITSSNLTASRVLVSNSNGKIAADANVTTTELGYLDGVTSSIQTQLNAKAADSDVVHKTGNENIAGEKTFNDVIKGITPTEDTTSSTQIDTVGARNTKLQSYQSKIPAGTAGQVLTYTGTAGSIGSATIPIIIKNVVVTPVTGVVTVTTSASPTLIAVNNLEGGTTIAGSWSGSGTTRTFTPTTASNILENSWIIVVD